MNTQTVKQELIKWITSLEDAETLNLLLSIRDEDSDWWEQLPENVKNDILKAKKEVKDGKGISHQEAMKNMRQKYPQYKWH